jgi:predicted O-methyltransferase YrrM
MRQERLVMRTYLVTALVRCLILVGALVAATSVAAAAAPSASSGAGPQHSYRFSTDWTNPYTASWAKALADFKNRPNIRYLEVGIWEGRSAFWMFENILTDPTSSAVGLDIVLTERLRHNVEVSGLGKRLEVLEGDSGIVLRPMPLASFDIIYVDASHLAKNVLRDTILCWPLLKPGGVMIFDDYAFGGGPDLPIDLRPRMALDAFLTAYRNELTILHREYQVIVKKLVPPCSDRCDQCSRIGTDYVYSWNVFGNFFENCTPQGLFRLRKDGMDRVPLKPDQEEAVKEALRALKLGETTVRLPAQLKL